MSPLNGFFSSVRKWMEVLLNNVCPFLTDVLQSQRQIVMYLLPPAPSLQSTLSTKAFGNQWDKNVLGYKHLYVHAYKNSSSLSTLMSCFYIGLVCLLLEFGDERLWFCFFGWLFVFVVALVFFFVCLFELHSSSTFLKIVIFQITLKASLCLKFLQNWWPGTTLCTGLHRGLKPITQPMSWAWTLY